MSQQAKLKAELIATIHSLWEDESFTLNDTERSAKLRPELLKRLLAFVMTDDERAALYGLPEGCRVREDAKIISPEKLNCGQYVWIGEGAIVDASGGLTIGDHSTIATGVYVWTHSSVLSNLTMNNQAGNPYIRRQPTKIGHGCFIGGPSVIYPNVTIGNKVVVMPMSVVTEDIPDNVMVAGSPARIVRHIDDEWIAKEVAALKQINGA
jgi:acetyltransferase-like isoleucine patch superfamily enzyme